MNLSNQHVYKHALVRQLSFVNPDSVNKYEQLVTDLLCDDSVDAQDLSCQIIQYIRKNVSVVNELIVFALDNNFERFSDLLKRQALHDLCKSNLIKIVLANVLINDYDFELFITMLRRFFLVNTNQSVILEKNERELCAAISIQCVFNGFILVTRDDEQIVLDKMIDSYDSSGISTDKDVLNLVMISMYIQLSKLLNNKCLDLNMKLIDHGSLIEIMYKYHMLDPVYESKIQVDIINDIEIIDDTSVSVMNMYESSPYPVWKKLNVPLTRSIENIIKDINPEFNLDLPYEGLPDILVAGCGTGRHAILNAMQIQNREVIAIDLSTSSLAYAIRMAEEHSVQNIQFKHMDILNVSELSRQFDVIESVGVLHHMDKPEVGLRSLVDNLKPGGLINIGLYSTIGRRYIKEAKERYHADEKVLSDMEVHTARHDIMRSTNNDMRVNLSGFCDFYSLHECRDMLFHISEHTYTLNEVSSLIDDAGLVFIGFGFTETTTPLAYKKMFPDDPLMTNLKNWSEFEKVNLDAFVSMYVFWCYKPV